MGGSSGGGTTVQKTEFPKWLQKPFESYAASVNAFGKNTDPMSLANPATANQLQAFQRAGVGTGNPTGAATGALTGMLGYQPQQVNPINVSAGQIAGTDLSPYMNPFQRDVIDATMNDWRQGIDVGLNGIRAGTPTGAFNGSRAGVAEGTFLGDNARTLASTLAGLNSQNYLNAQNVAGQDIGNRLQADLANQGAGMSAQTANQGAGLQAAGLNQQTAGMLGSLALQGAQNTRADTAAMADLGAQERAIAEESDPEIMRLRLLQAQGGMLGVLPMSGGTVTSKTSGGGGGALGGVASGALAGSAFGPWGAAIGGAIGGLGSLF